MLIFMLTCFRYNDLDLQVCSVGHPFVKYGMHGKRLVLTKNSTIILLLCLSTSYNMFHLK